jgi:O-antigen ligase
MFHFGLEGHAALALYFLGIAAFLASVFWRPSIGLYLLVFTLPMQRGRYSLHELPLGDQFLDILVLGVLLGMLVRGQRLEYRSPLGHLLLALAAFYYLSLWQGAFYLDSALPLSPSDPRFSDWKNYVELFLLFMIAASVVRDKRQAQLLVLTMALSTLVVNRSFYDMVGGRDFSRYSDSARYAGQLGYAGPNGFAAFEVMAAAFFIGIAAYQKKLYLKLATLGLVATCVYCILFSFSRAAYMGLLATLVTVGFMKERKLLILAAAAVIGWQTLLPPAVQQRISMTSQSSFDGQELDSSSQARVNLWEDALSLFQESPLLGSGFDTYAFLRRVGEFGDTHNYYVKVLVETGLIGLLLYLWMLKEMWFLGYSLARSAEDPFWKAVGLGFVALVTSAILLNFFGDRWTYQQVGAFLWISLGLVASGLRQTREAALAEEQGENEDFSDEFQTTGSRGASQPQIVRSYS